MYKEFFGFTDKPFNVTPDPRFLYLSPSHQEALASMTYGIRERRGFVTIIGEVGTGKTTLLHTLFKELDNDTTTVFIFNTRINFNQLLQNILIELELTPKSNNKSELLNQLNNFLIEKLSLGENVALIIDEAQNIPSTVLEELRMLSNLETPREKLLQILLVGQPELDYRLRSPNLRQLKQRIGINCYLTPLNHDEIIKYILHRLTIAGCKDNHIFSQKALELICNHSKGIPRIINILCDNALLSAYGKDQKRIDTGIIEDVIFDYESSMPPTNEKDKVITTVPEERKKISIKSSLAIVFLLAIITFLIIVISAYRNNHIPLDQIMHNVSTLISTTWQKIDRPTMDSTRKDNHQKPHTEDSIREANNHNRSITLQNEIISKSNPTIKEPTFSKRMSLPLEDHPMPTDSSYIDKNCKTVSAKKGDMVSSLVLREYGILSDTIFDIVKRANPDIKDLNQIRIGQSIILPDLGIDSRILEVGNGVFSVHVATFSSYDDAQQYLSKLMYKKHATSISPIKIAGKKHGYRVTVGNFTGRAQAIEFANNKTNNFPYKF